MGFCLHGLRRNIFLLGIITTLVLLGRVILHWNKSLQDLSQDGYCIPERLTDGLSRLYKLYDEVDTLVLLIGYSQQVDSLAGAVLDAHSEIIIPQKYDILGNWRMFQDQHLKELGRQKHMLFFHLQHLSSFQALFKNQVNRPSQFWLWTFKGDSINYNFIPGAWQGTINGKLKVIGDASAVVTSRKVHDLNGNFSVLQEMQAVVGIPVKFVHIVTNPFDSIASTVMTRSEPGKKINDTRAVSQATKTIFELLNSNEQIRQIYGNNVLDVYSHELRLKQRETLQKICTFLAVQCDDNYFKLVENIVTKGLASKPRDVVEWGDEDKDFINNEMKKFAFLKPFSFDSN